MDRITLLAEIDRFRKRVEISETAIGIGAVNDGKLVADLRKGRRCWPETAQKVLDFMRRVETEERAA